VRPFTIRTTIQYDSDANGVAETWYVGRLPTCQTYDADEPDNEGWDRLLPRTTPASPSAGGRRTAG